MDISAGAHQEPYSAEPASQEGIRVLLPDNRTLEKQTAEQLDSLKEFLQWEAVDSSTSSSMLDSTMVSVPSPIITIPEIYPSSPSSSVCSESQFSPCSLTPMSSDACSASEDFLLEDAMLGVDVDHLLRTFISVA
ncbi:hypothetical protein RvY_01213-2 [Ramazzottius varieornatus]|uniref:Uncharacterized protein n=1 Tax=Ramazzottius varieornatus TaxID=947166 RepID=A0A1D1UFH8_RAMVA|nr:hypothetical protein RvY_01213-2 [Ramazzottius varieornatus]